MYSSISGPEDANSADPDEMPYFMASPFAEASVDVFPVYKGF